MAKIKKLSPRLRRLGVSLTVLVFLLVALGITVSAVQERQDLLSFASTIIPGGCRKVPAGNYNVKVKTYNPISWEVSCPFPGGNRSGEIPPTTIPFGYRWVPAIYKGDNYTVRTTLKEICTSPKLGIGWSDVCEICQSIDCSKVKINGKLAVKKIECLFEAYRAYGQGNIELNYQGSGLGACSAKASYKGELMGSFVVGIKDSGDLF